MFITTRNPRPETRDIALTAQSAAPRRERRERDFGVGYGSSSGYRGKANYTRAWRPSLFKFG